MKEKISLEASGMPGLIKTMEKHFRKLIEKASRITEPQSEATVPTSAINPEMSWYNRLLLGESQEPLVIGAPDKGRAFRHPDKVFTFPDETDSEDLKKFYPNFMVGAPDKGRERKPCKTCGLETGYMWAERPEGAVIWCVNTRCVDFHTVFTPEEWEAR